MLTADGILTLNIFGNESNRSKSIEALQACFDSVVWLPEVDGGNVIVIAFKESPSIGFEDLYRRAQTIRRKTKLKSERWVEGLYEWMRGSGRREVKRKGIGKEIKKPLNFQGLSG